MEDPDVDEKLLIGRGLVQAVLAFAVVFVYLYSSVNDVKIPAELAFLAGVIISYFFGNGKGKTGNGRE